MVVLGLQLHGVRVVVANLGVASQEQTLVVHDPVKHLWHGVGGGGGPRDQTHTEIKILLTLDCVPGGIQAVQVRW